MLSTVVVTLSVKGLIVLFDQARSLKHAKKVAEDGMRILHAMFDAREGKRRAAAFGTHVEVGRVY